MTAHGTATSYKNGCRCSECRKANRTRIRDYRASKRGESAPVDLPVEVGEGTVAVRRDLAALQVAIERPADAAVALAMARLLDDVTATPQHPSAASRLIDVMGRLRADAAPKFAGNVTRIREGGKR